MKEQSESNLSDKIEQSQDQPCIDLTYLKQRTKSNPELMAEIISAYLVQTPPLISSMKQSLLDKDWDSLRAAVHKLIPSFAIMGISEEAENSAKKIQEYTGTRLQIEELPTLVQQIDNVCTRACKELDVELNRIKKTNQ